MDDVSVAQAFEAAIAAEKAAERLFQGLEAKFAHRADLAMFWHQYTRDEAQHAQWLEGLKAKLTLQQLLEPVDAHIVDMLQVVAGYSVDRALLRVRNLQDAYQLVNDVESSETNAIFRFLLDNFEKDEQLRNFLQAQLDEHISRLSLDLPVEYQGILSRQAIQALE
jgi:hypothetical protein